MQRDPVAPGIGMAKPVYSYSKVVKDLEKLVVKWQTQVDALVTERQRHKARICAARTACRNAAALMELGSLLEEELVNDRAHSDVSCRQWREQLHTLQQQLTACSDIDADAACLSLACGGDLPPLGWSPADAAARVKAAAEAGELTTAGLQSTMREFTQTAGCLLP